MTQDGARRGSLAKAAVATAAALAILVGLGIWQLRRLEWKTAMLARIDAAEQAPPVPLGQATPPLFTRVQVRGTLRDGMALYGAEVRGMRIGAQAIQLLDRDGEKPLLVVLGWVPADPPPHPQAGPAKITGYIRLPEPSTWLSAADDLQARHFYALNPTTIGAALGAAAAAPFTLVALGEPAGPNAPAPATALPRPVNNHLQYAFTWFGLAASLLGVFGAWVFRRRG